MRHSLLFIDLETTGPDPVKDKIVSLGLVDSDNPTTPSEWLINPERPIPPEATAVHGITDEMVKDAPPFRTLAKIFMAAIKGRNLAGFNLLNYDIPLLWEEFYAADKTCWDISGISVIDSGLIYKFKESRSLDDAVKLYAPELEHLKAHSAANDCLRTAGVLAGQLRKYPDLERMTVEELAAFSRGDKERIDAAGKLTRNEDGEIVYAIGRMKGLSVTGNPGAAQWMLEKDFSAQTKHVLREVLARRIR